MDARLGDGSGVLETWPLFLSLGALPNAVVPRRGKLSLNPEENVSLERLKILGRGVVPHHDGP